MLLQALNRYYDILLNDPSIEIAPLGYSTVGVSFALNISTDGELLDILPMFIQERRGKKSVELPRPMLVPEQKKRSGTDPGAHFLCDNSTFVLGISSKQTNDGREDTNYVLKRFEAFRQRNVELLSGVPSDAARAVVAYLEKRDIGLIKEHPAVVSKMDALLKGGNLVFMVNGTFVHDDHACRQAWVHRSAERGAIEMQCMVSGRLAPLARVHPGVKGVKDKNPPPGGVTLVTFNKHAYESYGRSQGQNAPVSEYAAFAYTTVLNFLLSDANPNRKFYLGDTTVVYWAESENRAYETAFAGIVAPEYVDEEGTEQTARKTAEAALKATAEKVKRVQMLDLDAMLADLRDENPRFYVLGLAPNAARVSVRFFITDPFQTVVHNMMAHYRDLAIVKEYDNQPDYLTVAHILSETVSKKSRDKDTAPLLAGAVFRAILINAPYPAALYYAVINRIRADMDDSARGIAKINYARAAIIKAYLLRKYRHQPEHAFQEVLTMALNEQSTNPAYVLGRLFAVLEKAQQDAIGNVNASIKDRYFTSACASPASVFPILLRLSQHHIAKAEYGYTTDRRIQDILGLLDVEDNPIPARLTLDEQGVFVLGYYHQRKYLWTAKPKTNPEASDTAS